MGEAGKGKWAWLGSVPMPHTGPAYNVTLAASDYTSSTPISFGRACNFIRIKPLAGCDTLHIEFPPGAATTGKWSIEDSDDELIVVDEPGISSMNVIAAGSSGNFSVLAY